MRVLVTGGTGFVGQSLVTTLASMPDMEPVAAVRQSSGSGGSDAMAIGTIGVDAPPSLIGFDAIVHCAARVHVMHDESADPLAEFRRTNVGGTVALAERAAADGARRFIFLSSVKVNGEGTEPGKPYRPDQAPAPVDPYGISKHEAETALAEISRRTGMDVVIIRPVLVYGPGVKGNFLSLLGWLNKGIPLPLAGVRNSRSMVSIANLCDLIATCLVHPAAAGRIFYAADAHGLSTTELLATLGRHMDKPARLFPFPSAILGAAAGLISRRPQFDRLFGSLEVDLAENKQVLGWVPPQASDDGLRLTAQWFRASRNA